MYSSSGMTASPLSLISTESVSVMIWGVVPVTKMMISRNMENVTPTLSLPHQGGGDEFPFLLPQGGGNKSKRALVIFHNVFPQAEGCSLAYMDKLPCPEVGDKFPQVPFKGDLSNEAAQLHPRILPCGVTLPVIPLQIFFFQGYLHGTINNPGEIKPEWVSPTMEIGEVGDTSQQVPAQHMEFRFLGQVAIVNYPGGCQK